MILLNIFLPLLAAVCAGFFSWWIGHRGASYLSTSIMFLNVILTLILFNTICFGKKIYSITVGAWIYSDSFQVDWSFYIDNLTITMLVVVNIISALVHLYSIDYMAEDPHLGRFMSYISLFTFFMILLVTGKNFAILFLGWEGVGLCSYLLISFWYTRVQANKAAIKALIVNRIADFALVIGMSAIFFTFKTLDFSIMFPLVPFFVKFTIIFLGCEIGIVTLICILLFIGAMGKSAQIGLHTWLPDAMEGPTPVSALIHAATMVTAGVFLIIKCSFLFEYVPNVLTYIAFIGSLTAFFAASVALVQNDIKKVIAYSTCSQLGYMIFACGLSNYHVGLFHLVNHAFFKALLFLSAGAIIHSLSNEQDMRKFGSLFHFLPFTAMMLLIGSLSLMGFPFLTGFYSKDLILELALTKYTLEGSVTYVLGLITAFFTSFYSFRVFYLTFIYKNNGFRRTFEIVHELPWKMAIVLSILSLGSLFFGYFLKDLFVGLGSDFWSHSILILPEHNNQLEAELFVYLREVEFSWLRGIVPYNAKGVLKSIYVYSFVKLLPFFFSIIAISLVYFLNSGFRSIHREPPVINFILNYCANKTIVCLIQDSRDHLKFKARPFNKILKDPTDLELAYKERRMLYVSGRNDVYFELFEIPDEIDTSYFIERKTFLNAPTYYKDFIKDIYSNEFEDLHLNKNKLFFRRIYKFLTYKWYFDSIYNELINRPLLKFAYNIIFSCLDKGLLELIGPYGISSLLFELAFQLKKMQLGRVYFYAYFIALFLVLSIILITLRSN